MSEDESRFGRYLGYAAAIATVVAVLVSGGVWLAGNIGGSDASDTPATQGPPASGERSAPPPGAASKPPVYLADLDPETGAHHKTGLPAAVAGYPHAVPVSCPTNQVGDKNHRLTYLLYGRYLSFRSQLRPYQKNVKTGELSRVEFGIFADKARRQGGLVAVNGSASLVADMEGVQELTIDVKCDSPEAVAILADAYLVPA